METNEFTPNYPLVGKNSACEVTFRMNQNTRVAAFANRDNKDSHRDQRAQMCNAFIMEMVMLTCISK